MKDERVEPATGEGAAGLHTARVAAPAPVRARSRLGVFVWVLILLAMAGAIGFTFLPDAGNRLSGRTAQPPRAVEAVPVGVVQVEARAMDLMLDALGTVTPLQMATVKPRVAGQITRIAFREGQDVKVGDVVAEIDDRPYRLALDQVRGQLLRDQALLKNAQIDQERYQKLVSQDSLARQQLDTQAALVQQYQGVVKTDEANVGVAELNLSYTKVTAPIAGRVGLKQTDVGSYVQPADSTGIVVITQLAPISVVFAIPEDELGRLRPRLAAGDIPQVIAFDRGRRREIAQGKLQSIDNQIDTTTGTVKIRAVFDNADQALFPNQFVNIRMTIETLPDALQLPQTAVQRGQTGPFVYRVGPDSTVAVVPVTLGPASLDRVAITAGVAAGDVIVVDGTDKLRTGTLVSTGGPVKVNMPAEGAARPAGQRRGPAGGGPPPGAGGGAQRAPAAAPAPATPPAGGAGGSAAR